MRASTLPEWDSECEQALSYVYFHFIATDNNLFDGVPRRLGVDIFGAASLEFAETQGFYQEGALASLSFDYDDALFTADSPLVGRVDDLVGQWLCGEASVLEDDYRVAIEWEFSEAISQPYETLDD